jgi:hypothetical protein
MNPLITSALLSTGQQFIEHCLNAPGTEQPEGGAFDKVLNQKLKEDFDVTQYLHDNGLQTPEDVTRHVGELKALLLENRELSNSALPHTPPESARIQLSPKGYKVASNNLEVALEPGTESFALARTIHHLESWLQNS